MCEIFSGFAYECDCRNGLHVLDELVYPEIINPETGVVLPEGQMGELVVTSIHKEATPIIRYKTGDITSRFLTADRCKCSKSRSSTYMIDRIHSRVDDMIFVKGLKFDPHLVRDLLVREFGEFIQADIQFEVSAQPDFIRPNLFVTLRSGHSEEFLKTIRQALQQETLIDFAVTNVLPEHFNRDAQNKIKLVIKRS